jgi:L-ribulose-5-phosphate 4-epimerase
MLEELKEQVCAANLDAWKSGLAKLTWGNVSGIEPERKLVVIKPSGVSYEKMKPKDMVVVGLDGKKVEGSFNPSTDTPTHLVLYRRFNAIGGVIHTHSIHASMFAQACRAIPCFGTTHADHFHGPVPVTRSLTEEEVRSGYEENTGKVIVDRFAELDPVAVPGVLVANHGPFAWGRDAADAVKNGLALEFIAEMALGTLALAPQAGSIPRYLLDKHYMRKHGPNAYYGQKK